MRNLCRARRRPGALNFWVSNESTADSPPGEDGSHCTNRAELVLVRALPAPELRRLAVTRRDGAREPDKPTRTMPSPSDVKPVRAANARKRRRVHVRIRHV